jgi:hypothetical protein
MWNSINIIDQFFDNPSDLCELYELALAYSRQHDLASGCCYHRTTPIESLDGECAIDRTISHLLYSRGSSFFHGVESKIKCVEFWVNFSSPEGRPLGFHLDIDEAAFTWGSSKELDILGALPIWSCCVHASPREIFGGATMISTAGVEFHNDYISSACPSLNFDEPHWVKVPYRFNRMLIFDSSYPYLVNPHESTELKVTLHMNFWDKELTKF